jgi:hypothetical protein
VPLETLFCPDILLLLDVFILARDESGVEKMRIIPRRKSLVFCIVLIGNLFLKVLSRWFIALTLE